ncbi:hypothetical protein C8T65DRAFT_46827 [Cerioporus squamosus]|nr:hypothetical protein C8T65DRAFT_46827 [Cerioporus squamosus]
MAYLNVSLLQLSQRYVSRDISSHLVCADRRQRECNASREQALQSDKANLTAKLEKAEQERRSHAAREDTLQQQKAAQAAALQAERAARKEAEQKAQEAREEAERVRREKDMIKQQHKRQDREQRKKIKQYEEMIPKLCRRMDELHNRVKFHAHSRTMGARRAMWEKEDALVHARELEKDVEWLVKQTEEQAATIKDQSDAIQEKNNAIRQLAAQMKACSQLADALAAEVRHHLLSEARCDTYTDVTCCSRCRDSRSYWAHICPFAHSEAVLSCSHMSRCMLASLACEIVGASGCIIS